LGLAYGYEEYGPNPNLKGLSTRSTPFSQLTIPIYSIRREKEPPVLGNVDGFTVQLIGITLGGSIGIGTIAVKIN